MSAAAFLKPAGQSDALEVVIPASGQVRLPGYRLPPEKRVEFRSPASNVSAVIIIPAYRTANVLGSGRVALDPGGQPVSMFIASGNLHEVLAFGTAGDALQINIGIQGGGGAVITSTQQQQRRRNGGGGFGFGGGGNGGGGNGGGGNGGGGNGGGDSPPLVD